MAIKKMTPYIIRRFIQYIANCYCVGTHGLQKSKKYDGWTPSKAQNYILPYSSMAEHLILVQGIRVRIAVGQQKQ